VAPGPAVIRESSSPRLRPSAVVLAGGVALALALTGCSGTGPDPVPTPSIDPGASFANVGFGYAVTGSVIGLDAPSGIAITPEDDLMYFSGGNGDASGVARVADSADSVEWLATDVQDAGFLATDAGGVLYVVDTADGTLHRSADAASTWSTTSAETGHFAQPLGVSAYNGIVAVTNTADDSLSLSTDSGTTWTSIPAAQAGLSGAAGVAVTADGAIWVANTVDASLAVSRDRGATWSSIPAETTGLFQPYAIAVGPHDEIYVTDPLAGSVSRSTDDGATWSAGYGFVTPEAIAVDPDGKVYVSDGVETIAQLTALPAIPQDVAATWVDDTTLEVTWHANPVTGGAPASGSMVLAEPQLAEDAWAAQYAGVAELRAAEAAGATTAPTPSGALPPTESWTVSVDGESTTVRIPDLPAGAPVQLSVTTKNAAGVSSAATVLVPAR
jgi:hypothetical protein